MTRSTFIRLVLCSSLSFSLVAKAQPEPQLPKGFVSDLVSYLYEHANLVVGTAIIAGAIGASAGFFAARRHAAPKPEARQEPVHLAAPAVLAGAAVAAAPRPTYPSPSIAPTHQQTDGAKTSAVDAASQQAQAGLRRRGSMLRKGPDEPAKPPEWITRRDSFRQVVATETPVERLFRLAGEMNQAMGQAIENKKEHEAKQGKTARDIAREAVIAHLREMTPDEIAEAAAEGLFWDKIMYDKDGFFEVLTVEQVAAAARCIAVNLERLKERQAIEALRKRLNGVIKALSGAADKHAGRTEEFKAKFKALIEAWEEFAATLSVNLRAQIQDLEGGLDRIKGAIALQLQVTKTKNE